MPRGIITEKEANVGDIVKVYFNGEEKEEITQIGEYIFAKVESVDPIIVRQIEDVNIHLVDKFLEKRFVEVKGFLNVKKRKINKL